MDQKNVVYGSVAMLNGILGKTFNIELHVVLT